MANQSGIAFVIKGLLQLDGSISEQISKLQMVETAHTTGDYSTLLGASKIEDIKVEQKVRRVEDAPAPLPTGDASTATTQDGNQSSENSNGTSDGSEPADASGLKEAFDAVPPAGPIDEPAGTLGGAEINGNDEPSDAEVPEFIKGKKGKAAA